MKSKKNFHFVRNIRKFNIFAPDFGLLLAFIWLSFWDKLILIEC